MKRTHKLRAIGDAREIVGFSRDRAEAAAQLGVNRSTLHRWIKAGKVPEPGSMRPAVPAKAKAAVSGVLKPGQSPDAWAKAVRRGRALGPTDLQLLDLARAALTLAYDSDDEKTQLSAMGRFQVLVKQLNPDAVAAGDKPARFDKPWRRPSAASMDPRKILSAVK